MAEFPLPSDARLVRELLAWLEEKGKVPMLVAARRLVVGDKPGVPADAEHVVLNLSERAVRDLEFGPKGMTFSTGFGPIHTSLSVPWGAVLQIGSADDDGFVGALLRTAPEGPAAVAAVGEQAGPAADDESPEPPAEPSPRRRFRIVTNDEG